MRVLKPKWEELAYQWRRDYSGCTCFLSVPCNSCVHEGNPLNLEETEEAWEEVYNIGDVNGTIKSMFHLRYLIDATLTFKDNAFHMTMCAYSVSQAINTN